MDRPDHFVSATALAESFSMAMSQMTEHIMQQNQQFQSAVIEQLNQRQPVQEFKVEGTSMPHFSGMPDESVDEFIFRAKMFMQGKNLNYDDQRNNARVVAMLASSLRAGAASWYHTRVAIEQRPIGNMADFHEALAREFVPQICSIAFVRPCESANRRKASMIMSLSSVA
ncbi:hypothetical protein AM588_10000503 [Phytophthora nicotianae]|uniref:CBL-interacting serine/threonine-protein kinase 23 n=1 Tax=Phytophthora nicotianae TaxID=4792 RepID=A0A0W8C8Y3_PHYNI|nr:CBL-interacting serine/threonine-protein kinase 23 [Phytophthora nicotianae]KUF82972.1 hypothetical protein AM588_10000503 [Phytophthora nicotianae]